MHKAAPKGAAAHAERCSATAGRQITNSRLQCGKFHASDKALVCSLLHFKGHDSAWLKCGHDTERCGKLKCAIGCWGPARGIRPGKSYMTLPPWSLEKGITVFCLFGSEKADGAMVKSTKEREWFGGRFPCKEQNGN